MVCILLETLATVFVLALVASSEDTMSQEMKSCKDHLLAIQNISKFWSHIDQEQVMVSVGKWRTLKEIFHLASKATLEKVCYHAYKCYVAVIRNRCEKYAALLSKFGSELMTRGRSHRDVLPAVSSALRSFVAVLDGLVHGNCVTLVELHHDEKLINDHPDDRSVLSTVLSAMATSFHNLVVFHSLNSDLDNKATANTVLGAVHGSNDHSVTSINKLGSKVLNFITRAGLQSYGRLYKSVVSVDDSSSFSRLFNTNQWILPAETFLDALDKLSERVRYEFGTVNDEFVNLVLIKYKF